MEFGAFEKALKNIGIDYELVGFSEIDKFAIKSYCAIHNVDESLNLGDITNIISSKALDKFNSLNIDLITHGSPCQDFSVAGKQAGAEKGSGTRSSLMWCTVDIVEALKPKYIIWENVKNLMSKKHIHNFNSYIEIMNQLGYNSYYQVLNAKDFSIPQNRERVYTISIRKDIDSGNFKFPEKQELKIRLKDILEETVDDKYYLSDKMVEGFQEHNKNHLEKGTGFIWKPRNTDGVASALRANAALCPTDNTINVGEVSKNSQAGQVYSEDGISPTLIAGTHGYAMGNILQNCESDDSPKCIRVGGMFDTENSKHQAGSVYNKDGLSPSLDSMQGGYRQPMITEQSIDNPLKGKSNYGWHFEQNVYSENSQCCRSVKSSSGSGNIPKIITVGNYSPSNHDASRIVDENGLAPTVKENHGTVTAVVQNVNENNKSNKIIYETPLERKGWHRKACEVLNTNGISTCIHTQSNNLLQKIKVENERFPKQAIETFQENDCNNGDTIDAFNKKINKSGISPTITTRPEGFKTAILPIQNYRIRKLTPKECWRLMGFKDEDIEKCIAIGISNSQLYKQAR